MTDTTGGRDIDDAAAAAAAAAGADQEDLEPDLKGPGSFCVPRAAVKALLENEATAHEICAYLTLARFTDETGVFSTAGASAVNRYTGANKTRTGPVARAIRRLQNIGETYGLGDFSGEDWEEEELPPFGAARGAGRILYDREEYESEFPGRHIPDARVERGKVLHVLPDFGEPLEERVWFGGNLVTGIRDFAKPLKAIKNAGDEAARLLLHLYACNDMENWGAVRPVDPYHRSGPWVRYEPVGRDEKIWEDARLIRAKRASIVADMHLVTQDIKAYWRALEALESVGLVYEAVMVLNRDSVSKKFGSGESYKGIHADAEPLYELDCRSSHGYKPKGETGLAGLTARTAGEAGMPVTLPKGVFDGTYAAIIRKGFPGMIAGLYRLRFRVANPRNAGVSGAWARIRENNLEAYDYISGLRKRGGLKPYGERDRFE